MMNWNYLCSSQMPCEQCGLVCIHVSSDSIDAEHCDMRRVGFESPQPHIIFGVAAVIDLQLSDLKQNPDSIRNLPARYASLMPRGRRVNPYIVQMYQFPWHEGNNLSSGHSPA